MINFLKQLNIDFTKFDLYDNDFSMISDIHGIKHVFNVMYNVLLIGEKLNDIKNTKISFCAAYIHDLSRKHDGHCQIHGYETIGDNFHRFKDKFTNIGLNSDDLESIKTASIYHSIDNELSVDHIHYIPTSILKDADALDRVRMDDLDPSYLRFELSKSLIDISKKLYIYNKDKKYNSFNDFLIDNLPN